MASTPRYKPAVELKSGDLRPTVTHTIRDQNGDQMDISNAEAVRFYMQHPDEDAPRVNATMDIVNAEEGLVEYEWQEGDTARADRHHAEFVIQWPDGSGGVDPQTDPARGYYFFDFDHPIGRGDAQEFDGRVDITVGHITADSGSFGSLTVNGEPVTPGGTGEHDHAGDTLNPDTVNAQSASVSSPPISDTDVVRNVDLEGISGGDPGSHDHTGDTLNPDTVNAQSASVSNPPVNPTDVIRQTDLGDLGGGDVTNPMGEELDAGGFPITNLPTPTLDTDAARKAEVDAKANADGSGTATLDNYAAINTGRLNNTLYAAAYPTLQDALDDCTDGDTLIITKDAGPITESVYLPPIDDLTIRGDDVEWNVPGGETSCIYQPQERDTWTGTVHNGTGADAIASGDLTLSVDNPSLFSAGDDVRIIDENEVYRDLTTLATGANQTQGEYQRVESVDGTAGTITLETPVNFTYSDGSGTLEVQRVDWPMRGLTISGIRFIGPGSADSTAQMAFQIITTKGLTVSDCYFEGWPYSMSTITSALDVTYRDCVGRDGGQYGFHFNGGCTHVQVDNIRCYDIERYAVITSHAGVMNPVYGAVISNSQAIDCGTAFDCHHGAEMVTFANIHSYNSGGVKLRGRKMTVDGMTIDGVARDTTCFNIVQQPADVTVRNVDVYGDIGRFCQIDGEEREARNVRLENICVEDSFNQFVHLTSDADGIYLKDITVDDMSRDRSFFFDAGDGYTMANVEWDNVRLNSQSGGTAEYILTMLDASTISGEFIIKNSTFKNSGDGFRFFEPGYTIKNCTFVDMPGGVFDMNTTTYPPHLFAWNEYHNTPEPTI